MVVNQDTGLPGEGISWFIDKSDFKKLSTKQKRAAIDFQLYKIFSFDDRDSVLGTLALKPLPDVHESFIENAKRYSSGGEGEQHKALKELIA